MCVCFLSVKRVAGDKGLQRQSSANECKLLWQPRRVTPSVSPIAFSSQSATLPLLLFLLFSTLSVSMAIPTVKCVYCTLLFSRFPFSSPLPLPPCLHFLEANYNTSQEGGKTSQKWSSNFQLVVLCCCQPNILNHHLNWPSYNWEKPFTFFYSFKCCSNILLRINWGPRLLSLQLLYSIHTNPNLWI